MSKTMTSALALLALAGAAHADVLPVNHAMLPASAAQATPLDLFDRGTLPAAYSSIPGPYRATAAGSFVNRDDYGTNLSGTGTFAPIEFVFVGGVTAVGGQLDVFFLDTANNVVDSFGVTLSQAGDFIWTITLDGAFDAMKVGQVQIQSRAGTTGRWFATETAANPGTNSFQSGHGSTFSVPSIGAYAFNVPTPGAAAVLGLAGLAAARRRRA